jgi:hypothetical protein
VAGLSAGRKKSSKSIGLKWLGARVEPQSHAERFLASCAFGTLQRLGYFFRRRLTPPAPMLHPTGVSP